MSLHKFFSRVPKDDGCTATNDDGTEVSKVTIPDYVPSELASGFGCAEYESTLPTMINLTDPH